MAEIRTIALLLAAAGAGVLAFGRGAATPVRWIDVAFVAAAIAFLWSLAVLVRGRVRTLADEHRHDPRSSRGAGPG